MREAEAKNALLAEQAAYAKKAAEDLEKAKAEAEARAKKEAEIKAAYMEQMKQASADLKSANELNLRTAQNLAFAQAKVEELKRKQEELEIRSVKQRVWRILSRLRRPRSAQASSSTGSIIALNIKQLASTCAAKKVCTTRGDQNSKRLVVVEMQRIKSGFSVTG